MCIDIHNRLDLLQWTKARQAVAHVCGLIRPMNKYREETCLECVNKGVYSKALKEVNVSLHGRMAIVGELAHDP